jgi:Xaa-Pro aminopeptidase
MPGKDRKTIGDPMVSEKLAQVPAILKELDIDAWLLFARETSTLHDPCFELVVGPNVTWQSAFVITKGGDRIAIVGSLDKANHSVHGHYPEIIGYVGGITEDLQKVLKRVDPKRIAINYSVDDTVADGLTHGMYLTLVKSLSGTPYVDRLESSERVVAALRGRKSETERARIRAACMDTVAIFERLTGRLRAGLTEQQVAALIREEMDRIPGLGPAWDAEQCPAVFTGPESAGAHTGPTNRLIEPGHIMNVDFGVKKNDYCSDLQRTWYFLRPGEKIAPDAVQRGFKTIVESIRAAARALKPGVKGGDIDQVARKHITDQGYPEYPHALGHQIGRTAHDGAGLLCPRWERYGKLPELLVEAGQVYTLEPRLPVEGHGIATCEEIVAVTDEGCEWLSPPQDRLYLVG